MTELGPAVIRRLTKELVDLQSSPCEGIRVTINEVNLSDIQAEVEGPAGTPFEGGLFRFKLQIPPDFPNVPPKGAFITKIFHPNISTLGEICVNVLKKDWQPEMGIRWDNCNLCVSNSYTFHP
jgi:ubiquitin-conjugating enzyme E2 S